MLAIAAPAAVGHGEAGLSEIARARAFWVQKPYALERSGDTAMGPDTVSLMRARPATPAERSSWLGGGICGIVGQETLVGQIGSYARGERYLVMVTDRNLREYHRNADSVAVIDLSDPAAVVRWFHTAEEALAACSSDPALQGKTPWETFDDGLARAARAAEIRTWTPIAGALALLLLPLAGLHVLGPPEARPRRRAKFLCAYSSAAALAAVALWLLWPEELSWWMWLLTAAVGVAGLRQGRSLRRAGSTLGPIYPPLTACAVALGLFGTFLLPFLPWVL